MIFILRVRKTNGPNIVSPVHTFIEMQQCQIVIKGDLIKAMKEGEKRLRLCLVLGHLLVVHHVVGDSPGLGGLHLQLHVVGVPVPQLDDDILWREPEETVSSSDNP